MAEFRAILRIANAEVKGETPIAYAIIKAKGASHMFSNAVCNVLKLDKRKRAGDFTEKEIEQIEDCLGNPAKYNIPVWMFNRRKELETGKDKHIVSIDLDLKKEFDVRRLKKIRSYKGLRHARGLPVRGQRTRTSFRTGAALGVKRKKVTGKK